MMKHLIAAAFAFAAVTPPGAAQADGPVLVELFTSQGCSSCPPADKLLGQLAGREDVIALSLHVDYWDYLGWKDQFADAAHTNRQRDYARKAGSTMVYTPQMVINGSDQIVGTKAQELAEKIKAHKAAPNGVVLTATRSGDALRIEAQGAGAQGGDLIVQLVRYTPKHSVEIRSGENAGKTVTYHNVVSSMAQVGTWDGAAPLDVSFAAAGDEPAVVIVQNGASGPVLASVRVK